MQAELESQTPSSSAASAASAEVGSAGAAPTPSQGTPPARRLLLDQHVLLVLVALSLGGIAVMDFSQHYGLWYWLAMLPIFAGASLHASWRRARGRGSSVFAILRGQLLHWGAMAGALYLLYVFLQTGRMNQELAGLVALLTLALTTFLAGVHFDWRLTVLGALLGATAAAAALVEEFFWLLLIPALVGGAVILLGKRRHPG